MKIRKLFTVLLAAVLSVSCFLTVGCAGKISGSDALEVYICATGNGRAWLDKALDAFSKKAYVKENYPSFVYKVQANDTFEYGQQMVLSGSTTIDLLFASSFSASTVKTPGKNGKASILEDLTDVYEGKIPDFNGGYEKDENGQDWIYGEKIKKADPNRYKLIGFEEEVAEDEYETHYYYGLTGTNKYGILYNSTKLEEYGFIEVDGDGNVTGLPRTTDELKEFATSIAQAGIAAGTADEPAYTAFVASNDTGYWTRVQNLWWAQYEGAEAYDRYFQGQYLNEYGDWEVGVEVLSKAKGRLIANQITEGLLKYDNEPRLIYKESSTIKYRQAQTYLMSGKGLMQANGTWFDNEMRDVREEGATDVIRLMPDVMVSDIIDVVPDKTIADDSELSALVGAMQAGSTAISGTFEGIEYSVSQADFNRVYEAYMIYNTGESITPTLIPSYSDAIDLAKDFMRFLATDECCRIYIEETYGGSPAAYYDLEEKAPELFNSLSIMNQERIKQTKGKSTILQYKTCNYPLVYYTGYADLGKGFELKYFSKNAKDRKSAADCISEQIATYTANDNALWNDMLTNAGLR